MTEARDPDVEMSHSPTVVSRGSEEGIKARNRETLPSARSLTCQTPQAQFLAEPKPWARSLFSLAT